MESQKKSNEPIKNVENTMYIFFATERAIAKTIGELKLRKSPVNN